MDSPHVLIVDDDRDLVMVIRTFLESAGYEAEFASDAVSAFTMMRQRKPDLVILDVMNTPTEGFHVSYEMRQDEALKDIPILMLTAIEQRSGMSFSPEKDQEFLPVEEFVTKPADPDVLIEKVATF